MKATKIVFIIPGFRHKITSKGYQELSLTLRREGFYPVRIAIPWKESTIGDNTTYFLSYFKKKLTTYHVESKDVYVLGFSYGALIALLAATKISVKGLLLCSLSPFFHEDLPKRIPFNASTLQIKRLEIFSTLYAKKIAQQVKAKRVCMLYGEKESKPLIARVTKTFKQIPTTGKYLFSIKNTDHTIADKKYISAIHFATSFL